MSEQPNVKRLFSPAAISFGYDGFRGNMRTGSLTHDENRRADGGFHHVTGHTSRRTVARNLNRSFGVMRRHPK